MTAFVFDSSALLAYMQERKGSLEVTQILESALQREAEIFMSTVNYGEVYSSVLREGGADRALATLGLIRPLPIRLVDATPERALRAGEVKTKYRLYYADSFAAALAMEFWASLVTGDSDFHKLGHNFPIAWLR